MLTVAYILIAVLIFGFLIAVHELGHFLTAKLLGVQVNEFSINMGPKLIQRKKGETIYSLRLLPIGGYCAMEGEDGESDNPRAFTNAKWWRRLIILCAGSFMNFLAGFLILVILNGVTARYGFYQARIEQFMDGNILQEQGFEQGDEFYAVDGKRVFIASDLDMLVERHHSPAMDVTVRRDGRLVTLRNVDMTKQLFRDADGNESYKFGFYMGVEPSNPWTVTKHSFYESLDFTRMVWFGLSDMIAGRVSADDVGGPVKIVAVMTDTGKSAPTFWDGLEYVLYIGAFIAVNLAVMNMLPIPALDGGRVFLLLVSTVYTAITKKKINPKYEGYIHAAGMVLLLGLMAVIFVKDIVQIIRT